MVADERWYFMKEKLQRFMWGRYGNDRFNQFLMIVALVCLALSFFGLRIFYVLALALLVYIAFSMAYSARRFQESTSIIELVSD